MSPAIASSVQENLLAAQNYRSWRRYVEIGLLTKRKLGFIRGNVPRSSDRILSEQWETSNNMVKSLLMASVSVCIAKSIMFIETAYEIWIQLEKRFALSNRSRKYKLNRETYDIVQSGITSVTAEITAFLNAINTQKDEQRLFQFLNGLDEHYSDKGREVFDRTLDSSVETTALYTKAESRDKCTIYGYKWHPADKCWEKVGYSIWHYKYKQNQEKNKGKTVVRQGINQPRRAVESSGHVMFSSKQFEQLMRSLPYFNDMKYSADTDKELDNEFVEGHPNDQIAIFELD
ncbi:hypothetical protein CTI12_AA169360 [Artemisia annua]|uniref:Retrotransposon Copia-like N-terminal domain-containing protein n=1 Tax=Artemisia annua TaxID=35608 RepID=A0A2U1PC71_ARTAN|nr:hypothetical protein CTI12_AA169360 [Artemisia annua]